MQLCPHPRLPCQIGIANALAYRPVDMWTWGQQKSATRRRCGSLASMSRCAERQAQADVHDGQLKPTSGAAAGTNTTLVQLSEVLVFGSDCCSQAVTADQVLADISTVDSTLRSKIRQTEILKVGHVGAAKPLTLNHCLFRCYAACHCPDGE